jgi:hypothetical protein
MRMKIEDRRSPADVYSLQNLVVEEAFRSGVGIMLVKQSIRQNAITVFPGVAPALARAYRALKYPEVTSFWGRRVLRPVSATTGVLAEKIGLGVRQFTLDVRQLRDRLSPDIEVLSFPDEHELNLVAEAFKERERRLGASAIAWTADTLRWRFFSIDGPLHLLFTNGDRTEFCIASFGTRRNVRIVRPIEIACAKNSMFLSSVLNLSKKLGAEVSLCFAARDAERDVFLENGFTPVSNLTTSFVVDKVPTHLPLGFTASLTDVGFEAFNTTALGVKRVSL